MDMAKVFGTESTTPTVKPMSQPSVITSGEITISKKTKLEETLKFDKKGNKKAH